MAIDTSRSRRRRGIVRVDLGGDYDRFESRVEAINSRPSAVLRGLVVEWLAAGDLGGGLQLRHAETSLAADHRRGFAEQVANHETNGVTSRPLATPLPGRIDGATSRVEIRLTASEHQIAHSEAAREGFGLNRWIAGMVRARLTCSPVLGQPENAALTEASFQLGAIGRNLNQIVRAMNRGGVELRRYPDQRVIEEIAKLVDSEIRLLRRVLADNQKRWALVAVEAGERQDCHGLGRK